MMVKILYRCKTVLKEYISERKRKYTAYFVHSHVITASVYVLQSTTDAKLLLVKMAKREFQTCVVTPAIFLS
jgi:hypothetical protein